VSLLLFNSPPLEEGGVPEGRGGYSPLWNVILLRKPCEGGRRKAE